MSVANLINSINRALESNSQFTEAIVAHNETLNLVRVQLNALLDGGEGPLEGAQIVEQIQSNLTEITQLSIHLTDVLSNYRARL